MISGIGYLSIFFWKCFIFLGWNLFQEWKFWLSGVATLVVGTLGIIGNTLSIVVLSRRWAAPIYVFSLIPAPVPAPPSVFSLAPAPAPLFVFWSWSCSCSCPSFCFYSCSCFCSWSWSCFLSFPAATHVSCSFPFLVSTTALLLLLIQFRLLFLPLFLLLLFLPFYFYSSCFWNSSSSPVRAYCRYFNHSNYIAVEKIAFIVFPLKQHQVQSYIQQKSLLWFVLWSGA